MADIREFVKPEAKQPTLEPIQMPDWVEAALKAGLVAAAAALAKGMADWASKQK